MNEKIIHISSLAKDFELTQLKIGTPHSKTFLTTRLGRLVDGASYNLILLVAFLTLEYSTLYFYLFPGKDGINLKTADGASELINATYFSIITFTSLGYGDITPQGYGKLVAGAVVLCGLVLVALLIGKIASERQFSVSLLLYTSDCQRRLMGFCSDLKSVARELTENIENSNPRLLSNSIEEMQQLVEVISKYVTFHAHQARLAHFGNDSALKALYVEMLAAQKICSRAFQSHLADETGCKRCLRCVIKITNITTLLTMFQSKFENKKTKKTEYVSPELVSMAKVVSDLQNWACTHTSPWLLSKVILVTPADSVANWSKDLPECIAIELGISKSLARRCINDLVGQKRVPRKVVLSKRQIEEKLLKNDLSKILDTLNSNTLALEQQKSSGAPILDRLRKLSAVLRQVEDKTRSNAACGRFFNHSQIEQKFRQLYRTQLSILDICHSTAFDDWEKDKAEALAYSVSQLADCIFRVSNGVEPVSIKFYVFKIFNGNNKFFDIKHVAYVKKMKRQRPRINLEELFALSAPSRIRDVH